MALFERRSSMEIIQRWREQSSTDSDEQRSISFKPGGQWTPAAAQEEAVQAFQVSTGKRIAQVCIAVIYCLLAAGIVFGFAALKPVLIAQGVYADRCDVSALEGGVANGASGCYEQEMSLNFMFTVAVVCNNMAALPIGTVLDYYGPRVASLIGVFFLTLGALSLAFAADLAFDAYIPGYLFLAIGGPFVFISSFQLSNTFPRHSGLILALLTGAFDTSSAVFLVYRLIFEATDGTFDLKRFFLIYLIVPGFILVAQILIMPRNNYNTVGELVRQAEDPTRDTHDSDGEIADDAEREAIQTRRREHRESIVSEITALLGPKTDTDEQTAAAEKKASRSGVWGALHGRTAGQQIASWWFVLVTLFTVVQMTRINYFVATIWNQYAELLGSDRAATRINQFFDVALPLGGVIAIPFIGGVLDNTSTTFVLALLVSFATIIGGLGCLPEMAAAYANIVLFTLYRPFYYTAISDYSAKVFGYANFGKVYGLVVCLAGIFNFSQAGLIAATHMIFDDDPLPVNLILLSVGLATGTSLVGYVWRKSYTMKRELLEEEAESAPEVLMPNVVEERGRYGT